MNQRRVFNPEADGPLRVLPNPLFPVRPQPAVPLPPYNTVVPATNRQPSLDEDEKFARMLQKEEEEEEEGEEMFNASRGRVSHRDHVPYTSVRTEESHSGDVIRSRQSHLFGARRIEPLEDEEKVPCEFCNQPFSLAKLMLHQVCCVRVRCRWCVV